VRGRGKILRVERKERGWGRDRGISTVPIILFINVAITWERPGFVAFLSRAPRHALFLADSHDFLLSKRKIL
jgi:hypothetical protein